MKKFFVFIVGLFIVGTVFAVGENIPTSKTYVDNAVAQKQNTISANNGNAQVLTNTGTPGSIGTKNIYDASGAYAEQTDALVTAGAFNTAVQNAIESEFVCVEYDANGECLLLEIRSAPAQSILPNGYTALEYIESTGTQWIDTGVATSDNLMIDVTFQFLTELAGNEITVLFGASRGYSPDYPTDTQFWIQQQFFWIANCYSGNGDEEDYWNHICIPQFQDLNKHHVIFNNYDGGVWWDNRNIGTFLPYTSNGKIMYIGTSNHPAMFTYSRGNRRTYNVIFTNKTTGQKIRNFIPARRDSDGVLGMYDTVSNTFFTNSGTGEFIAGPVFSYLPQN